VILTLWFTNNFI